MSFFKGLNQEALLSRENVSEINYCEQCSLY